MEKLNFAFKICIFGDSGVGKSTLINRYITAKFDQDLKSTLGAAILIKSIETEIYQVKLQIWDFGGESRFNALLPSYAQGSSAAIFMCDITNSESISNIDKWLLSFNKGLNNQDPTFPLIIIGGKLDLEHQRSLNLEDIKANLTIRENYDYIECSSKTGENVDLVFQTLVKQMLVYGNISPSTS